MLEKILVEPLKSLLSKYDIEGIYEIRLRRNCPVVLNYKGKYVNLTRSEGEKVYTSGVNIEQILKLATQNSLYAYNNQLKQGFLTTIGGIRIGVAGESVNNDNFLPTTIKDITSLVIRIPHQVQNCSQLAFKFISSKDVINNTLIVSPPGAGKTTFLRDIACQFSKKQDIVNVMVVDERFELASCLNGEALLDVGCYSDIVSGAGKKYAFSNGIRALRPDVIITDEDCDACILAINSGVKVIASVHAKDCVELKQKKEFKELVLGGYFERIIFLSNRNGPGTLEKIYDKELNCIYF